MPGPRSRAAATGTPGLRALEVRCGGAVFLLLFGTIDAVQDAEDKAVLHGGFEFLLTCRAVCAGRHKAQRASFLRLSNPMLHGPGWSVAL